MDTARLADEMLEVLDRGSTIASIVERNPGFDWDAGYRVAAAILKLRRARGEKTVGRKIGFTNRNIWAEYGATAPIWAHVYDRTLILSTGGRTSVSLKGSARPRLEPEIAFKLKAPLSGGVADPVHMLESIEWLAPSFEIVDCHFADWKFKPADSAVDFALHWRLIVGTPVDIRDIALATWADQLRDCRVTLSRDGAVADCGVGANALGHPLIALAHLAQLLATQPQFDSLAAGEIVTTGTLTSAMPIRPGETWSSRYEGLAGVTGLALSFVD